MSSWLEKYKPKKIEDVVLDSNAYNIFIKFLESFDNPTPDLKPNILITGPNGTGKTLVVELTLEKLGYKINYINLSALALVSKKIKKEPKRKGKDKKNKKLKDINEFVYRYYKSCLEQNYIDLTQILIGYTEEKSEKSAIVIDNLGSITNNKEKKILEDLIKVSNIEKKIPIIFIGHARHNKVITEIRKKLQFTVKGGKKSKTEEEEEEYEEEDEEIAKPIGGKKKNHEILIYPISKRDLARIMNKIVEYEEMVFDGDVMEKILDHAQGDARRLINTLEELKQINGNIISSLNFTTYASSSGTKDISPGIRDATFQLLNSYENIKKALNLHSEERSTMPLMFHEYFTTNIRVQYPKMSPLEQLELAEEISKHISFADYVDGLIFSNQCWSIQDIHGFYSCVYPSYLINKNEGKKCNMENYEYIRDFNRTSTRCINSKTITAIRSNDLYRHLSVTDLVQMSTILKKMWNDKKIDAIAELMAPSDCKAKMIEDIIKVDKIEAGVDVKKTSFSQKQRETLDHKMDVFMNRNDKNEGVITRIK